MANYKDYNYDQTIMVPVTLTDQLFPGTLEYEIHYLIENRVDMSIFDKHYKNDDTGAPAYDPKILLKVILMGYSRGLLGSRKIEKACRENIIFMALCCGKVPDYSTICNFVKSLEVEIIHVFRNILMVCDKENLLGGTRFALDGCKMSSNASNDWTGTHDQLRKKIQRMENKVRKLLKKHIKNDDQESNTDLPESDKNKIERLNRHINKIEAFLESNAPRSGSKRKEVKSNITDNDSAQMITSHGTIQGYNAQALVDSKHQIIVSSAAFGDGQDHNHVTPMLDQAKENMQSIGKPETYFEGTELLCDASYHSQENINKSVQEKMDAYIPDVNYRKRDPRLHENQDIPFSPADFDYDEKNDQYICPNGSLLKLKCKNRKKGKKLYRMYLPEESACLSCRLRKRCLMSEKSKRRYYYVYQDKKAEQLARQMYKKFETEEGRTTYDQRAGIIEPVFANTRIHKQMNRFTMRGDIKVNIQWRLYTIIHNIEKIAKYGSDNALHPAII